MLMHGDSIEYSPLFCFCVGYIQIGNKTLLGTVYSIGLNENSMTTTALKSIFSRNNLQLSIACAMYVKTSSSLRRRLNPGRFPFW